LEVDGERYTVQLIGADAVWLRNCSDGGRVVLHPTELVYERSVRAVPEVKGPYLDAELAGDNLTPEKRADLDFWVHTLDALVDDLARARANGDPLGAVYKRTLAAVRSTGRTVSESTLKRRLRRFLAEGVAGLFDARVFAKRVPRQQAFAEALREVLQSRQNDSTGTKSRLLREAELVARESGERAAAIPSERTQYRVLSQLDPAAVSTGSARTRQGYGLRPDRDFSGLHASVPGGQVQIDSTPLDVLIRYNDGNFGNAELTIMVDVASCSILAAVIRPYASKAVDLVMCLLRAVTSSRDLPGSPGLTRELVRSSFGEVLLPEEQLEEFLRRVPLITPRTIVTDNGSIYKSLVFRAACESLGINLTFANKHTPTDKGKVERTFGAIATMFLQYLPGYRGRSVEHRGTNVEAQAYYSVQQLQVLLDQWVAVVWQNHPSGGLHDPLTPNIQYTPNEMALASRRLMPTLEIPLSPSDYLAMLPVYKRKLRPEGFPIDHRIYSGPGLRELRGRRPAGKERPHVWPLRYDPYNIHTVWVEVDQEFLPLQWVNGMRLPPMSADVYNIARAEHAARSGERAGEEQAIQAVEEMLSRAHHRSRKQRRAMTRSDAVNTDPLRPQVDHLTPQKPIIAVDDVDGDTASAEDPTPMGVEGFGLMEDE